MGRAFPSSEALEAAKRLRVGNLQYSRFGNLRYRASSPTLNRYDAAPLRQPVLPPLHLLWLDGSRPTRFKAATLAPFTNSLPAALPCPVTGPPWAAATAASTRRALTRTQLWSLGLSPMATPFARRSFPWTRWVGPSVRVTASLGILIITSSLTGTRRIGERAVRRQLSATTRHSLRTLRRTPAIWPGTSSALTTR